MKKFSLIAILLIAVMMIVGCSHNAEVSKNADESENVSFSANNTENNNSKIVTENESSTQISTTETTTAKNISKPKTEESTTASNTATKPTEQKSAGQTTTKKQSETNAKKDYTQTTATNHETTKAVVTTKKETATKKQTTTEKSFDINYWVSYAKDYAKSVGLEVNSSASDCWDNPISANSKCKYLERDIKGRLNRYAKDEDITQVWVWAEKTSADSYNIYIGYA